MVRGLENVLEEGGLTASLLEMILLAMFLYQRTSIIQGILKAESLAFVSSWAVPREWEHDRRRHLFQNQ